MFVKQPPAEKRDGGMEGERARKKGKASKKAGNVGGWPKKSVPGVG